MTGAVRLGVQGPVATVTIDRPAKRNALTVAMWHELAEVATAAAELRELRAVVVTGAGPSFCAGADISSLSEDDATLKSAVQSAELALRAMPVPTIAALRGHCMGGGNQIAVACDLRVADTTARFGIPPARLSVIYPPLSMRWLVELVGPAVAKRLIFTAEVIDAEQALRVGLIEQLVPAGELDNAVAALVADLLPLAPLTQAAAKQLIDALADGAPVEALHARWMQQWQDSPDGAEGPQAFLQRRPPRFSWQPPG